MGAEEGQQAILHKTHIDGHRNVISPAAELAVTTETIRRDRTSPKGAGVVRRRHGGALLVEQLGFEPAAVARTSRAGARVVWA